MDLGPKTGSSVTNLHLFSFGFPIHIQNFPAARILLEC